MGKNRRFLGFLASLVVIAFVGNAAAVEGYLCERNYVQCNANYYLAGTDIKTCKACGANSTTSGGKASTCTCNTGYTADGTPGGSKTSTTGCRIITVHCDAGEYLPAGATACETCPANSWCADSKDYTYNASQDQGITGTCLLTAGYASDAGSTSFEDCIRDCESNCSGNDTAACPENSACTYDTDKKYPGTQNCTNAECSTASTCDGSGLCPMESFSCNPNHYKTGDACNACGENSSSLGGDVTTCTCNTGYSADGTPDGATTSTNGCQIITVHCDAGKYLPAGATACATCTAGNYCEGGQFEYNNDEDQGLTGCPENYKNSDAGAKMITQCYSDTKKRPWTGDQVSCSTPGGCDDDKTECLSCSVDPCEYVAYSNNDGTGDGAVKGDGCTTNNAPCYQQVASVEALENYYVSGRTCNRCSGEYPLSAGGDISEDYCYKNATLTGMRFQGDTPENCASVTQWDTSSCTPTDCTYKDYKNAPDETCTPTDCTMDPLSVTASGGYYVDGITCEDCPAEYPLSANPNSGGISQCYKNCTKACTKPTCPENASCDYEETSTSGVQYYNGSCNAADSKCDMTINCDSGYKLSQNGTSCEPIMYQASFSCGTGATGNAPGSQSPQYSKDFTWPDRGDCKKPGNTFVGWSDGSITVQGGEERTWYYTENVTFTAVWEPCDDTSGAGTCDCPSTHRPNGSGACESCTLQCATEYPEYPNGSFDACKSEDPGDICNRACVVADMGKESTAKVQGYVYQSGTMDCDAVSCKEGYYLTGGENGRTVCAVCVPNATCPGGDEPFVCDFGYRLNSTGDRCEPEEIYITLNKNGGTGTVNGVTGTSDSYTTCGYDNPCSLPTVGDDLTRVGYAFTGWGTEPSCTSGSYRFQFGSTYDEVFRDDGFNLTMYACWSQTAEQCQLGKYYNGTNHVDCPAGYVCPGTGSANIGTPGCSEKCPGEGTTSTTGATEYEQCFVTCPALDDSGRNGTTSIVNSTEFWDGSSYPTCTYKISCNAGYVATGQNTANPTCEQCNDGEICPGGESDNPSDTCPDGGTSAPGASSITDCYKTCDKLDDSDRHGTTSFSDAVKDGKAYHTGTAYTTCTYEIDCDEGYTSSNSPGTDPTCTWDADCPDDSYCDTDGPHECPNTPDGTPGSTAGTGASAVTDCYYTCPDKREPTGATRIENNQTRVSYSDSDRSYPTCTYHVTCAAGYVVAAGTQDTANAHCEPCKSGENCPGGDEEIPGGDPKPCPEGYYCENGVPKQCPEGGTSEGGSSDITDCFAPCEETPTVENATDVESTGAKYYSTSSGGYPACTYNVTCKENYIPGTPNPSAKPSCVYDSGECPPGSWCDPDEGGGEPQPCPDGGTSDGGATAITQCYVLCSRTIANGTLTANSERQYYDDEQSAYPACTYTAYCDAGYVVDGEQGTPDVSCRECDEGDYCPGGGDDEPQACPDGGISAAGASSIEQCYKTCPATIPVTNAVNDVANKTGDAYYDTGISDYAQCKYKVTCDEGYKPQNSPGPNPTCEWENPDDCPEDYYCPPESPEPILCPEDENGNHGHTDGGATSVTQCYHIYDPYDGFQHGTASAKCNYQTGTQKYDWCNVDEVYTCDAGYHYLAGLSCSPVSSGYYSPEGETDQTQCPAKPDGNYTGVASIEYADDVTDCYMPCEITVANSSTVAAQEETVPAISTTEYKACVFHITCKDGYTPVGDGTSNPSCKANEYTVTLDKNGGTGSTPASVKCTFGSECELPSMSGLTRPGYGFTDQPRWCTNQDGTGTCYYAGQATSTNISATGTDTTLYAAWVPNVYTINLDHNGANTNGAPDTVYLKYATGWFSNKGATTGITKLTTLPTKSGYDFAGYYSAKTSGVQVIGSDGAFVTGGNALTFTTTEPTTVYAMWSAGTTHCDAGTYYTGTGVSCAECTAGNFCPGGDFGTGSGVGGLNSCPNGGTSNAGAASSAECFKTGLAYEAEHGSGTQTCKWSEGSSAYDTGCSDIKITACDGGYWLANSNDTDCSAVGKGFYSANEQLTRDTCPDGGSTETEISTVVQDCFKTGLVYNAVYGAGTQRCFYTSGQGSSAIYQRDCDTKVITSCRAGYWLANNTDTDCSVAGKNYYSGDNEIERHLCPAGGKTDIETADSVRMCNKDGQPYEAEHGSGERTCFYTSGEGDSAVYSSNCENITMTRCDGGYYYDRLQTTTDCVAVGKGYYSLPSDMERNRCPNNGMTETTTSDSPSACYLEQLECDVTNGVGEQTCNYDADAGAYTLDCTTCIVTECDPGFSQVDNTCIGCPEDSVCDEGEQKTCSSLTDGMYPHSDSGTEDVAMCYRDCALAENAASMNGRDYYGAQDTCEIASCQAGYTLNNGICDDCPPGSFCDGDEDPENPGDDVKSCADLGNGEWPMSDANATSENDCYHTCEAYEVVNGTAVPVSDKAYYPNDCVFEGMSDTGNPCDIIDGVCVETSCSPGYEMINGTCEPCDREFALSYTTGGVCQIAVCVLGYHPNGDQCEPNVMECTAPNAVYAEKTWDFDKKAFGSCMIQECEYGYHVASNACVSDVQPCNVENGIGFKEWDHDNNEWGTCIATKCNPGYTSDPSLTNERTKQCGECRNKYGANGRQAVSSYVEECEIASCMYQGELYNLEYGECVQICPTSEYSDETGSMVWDEGRKKCVRTCNDGYTMW